MRGGLGLTIAVLALVQPAGAQSVYPYGPAPMSVPRAVTAAVPLSALPGWSDEDPKAALSAVQSACSVTRVAGMSAVCRDASALGPVDATTARSFLEDRFEALPEGQGGTLTGYFMPVYDASAVRTETFSAPVRPRPADLPMRDRSASGRWPYAGRVAIDERPTADALAWMRPEDLFFMQIQGSGVLEFAGGERRKAVFAGDNGAPFVAVANPMRQRGLLDPEHLSAGAIHAWLADHRGSEADAIMDLDPRYVFFSLASDDGLDPFGAAGARLAAGRAVAVDPASHAMGELLWLDGEQPGLAGAWPAYRRMVTALDTGGAIKGPVRADLYVGRGTAAGLEAGRIRHSLSVWRIVPAERAGE